MATRNNDKLGFYYKPINFELRQGSTLYQPGCVVTACGERQARSFDDEGSNYCSMRELYCGAREDCRAFNDLGAYVEKVEQRLHSTVDRTLCGMGAAANM